jgi:diguanylate cyclase (GGDEF)-like protein
MMELSYWAFSIWGICVSWRMYLNGNQMLIMDTVQIVFAFLICSYPLWGVIRVVTSYVILFLILFRTDGAAQINLAIYSLMAGMLCFGTVLRYGMELRNLEQMHALASHARAMENRSTHDELTGMKNRMALREDFPGYCHETLCVIMADVDHFKRYNDTYGHEVGDQILIAVASEITNLFGEDSTYRYGGDEFLIIQKDYTRSEISTLLMVWADAVRNIRLDIIPEEGDFSCSYGFTYGRPSGEEELRQMVVRADRKLYEMKRSPSRVSHSALAASRPGQI